MALLEKEKLVVLCRVLLCKISVDNSRMLYPASCLPSTRVTALCWDLEEQELSDRRKGYSLEKCHGETQAIHFSECIG